MHAKYQSFRELNVVVLGAGGVGKSCLTAQFVHNEWIEAYDPTIEDSHKTQISVDGRQVVLDIMDTAGTLQFAAMQDLYIRTGQGFILVFSITSQSSLADLEDLRELLVRIKGDVNIPIVIVGNKADLEDMRQVPRSEAFQRSREWGAPYYESSARTRTNVDEVFIDLCRQMLRRDDITDASLEEDRDDSHSRHEHRFKKRKRRRRRGDGPRCVIL